MGKRFLVEDSIGLRADEISKLVSGAVRQAHLTWARGSADSDQASVRVEVLAGDRELPALCLGFHVHRHDRLLRVRQTIELCRTPQRLGGYRLWFTCPSCGRRCGVLYLPPWRHVFRCRLCHQLAYECEGGRSHIPSRSGFPGAAALVPEPGSVTREVVADLIGTAGLSGLLGQWQPTGRVPADSASARASASARKRCGHGKQ